MPVGDGRAALHRCLVNRTDKAASPLGKGSFEPIAADERGLYAASTVNGRTELVTAGANVTLLKLAVFGWEHHRAHGRR
jgi:hypothetical protein